VPKQRRREQQHLHQQSTRRREYQLGGQITGEKLKPPFPMNLMTNVKVFVAIGLVAMVGGLFVAALMSSQTPTRAVPEVPTATPSPTPDPNATPTPTATPDPRQFSAAEQVIDAENKEYTATIRTAKGDIVLKLYADKAPNTVNSFVFLAQKGYFDGLTFHRVEQNFVIQGGDPRGDGTGGPGYETQLEETDLKNTRGMVAMARAGTSRNFGSQFFINLKDNPALDAPSAQVPAPYYPFAEVIQGMDVVDRIARGDVMVSVTIEERDRAQ
jgi:cyclophilin family peptidyl-prolyl cis-trans isomerase